MKRGPKRKAKEYCISLYITERPRKKEWGIGVKFKAKEKARRISTVIYHLLDTLYLTLQEEILKKKLPKMWRYEVR